MVMAWFIANNRLKAPNHYLNQCWILISEVLWHSPSSNFLTASAQATVLHNEFENYTFEITAPSPRDQWVNSLWPSDAIWRHRSESTLTQEMACCLTASSHYLNQCWLIITKVLWHSFDDCFSSDAIAINHWISFEIGYLKFYLDIPGAKELNIIG